MAKKEIPVYDICSLQDANGGGPDLLVEPFAGYLARHYEHLHTPHRHSFYHLVLFTKGSGTHSIDFTSFDVKPYQVYFMAPGQVHAWNFKGAVDGYIINFAADFFRDFLLHTGYLSAFPFFSGDASKATCQLPVSSRPAMVALFDELVHLNEGNGLVNRDLVRVNLLKLFLLVESVCKVNSAIVIPQQKQLVLSGFKKLIDENFIRMRLPKDYAKLLYITPNHLNALCQDLLGKTAGELIRDRLLLEAKRLLVNAGLTVTQVADELDFQDNSYFGRFFKKYTGQTPEEFRKQF
ncbi:MAG: helix-turn-helix domain-containing protein [Chitinophagaceae bacterium]|nr:MAG: helix-turn-helix domain-containing protein [Chitinophagaceae bacterium]